MEITKEKAKRLILETYVEFYLRFKELNIISTGNDIYEARTVREIHNGLSDLFNLTDRDDLETIRYKINENLNNELIGLNNEELYEILEECEKLAREYQLGIRHNFSSNILIIDDISDSSNNTKTLTPHPYMPPMNQFRYLRFDESTSSVSNNTQAVNNFKDDVSSNNNTQSASLRDRIRMGTHGIAKSGPCFVMSCIGVAQTYVGINLSPAQVNKLLRDTKIWNGKLAGLGSYIIRSALEELSIDTSNLEIDVIAATGGRADPGAFATIREVGIRTATNSTAGHFQEGTNTGSFRWDPLDGTTDIGRKVGGIRNVFITIRNPQD